MRRQSKQLLFSLLSMTLFPSVSFADIYRCSPDVSDQQMQLAYAQTESPRYISGDVVIGFNGSQLSFVSYETARVFNGEKLVVTGKRNIQCDTEYSTMNRTLECWDNYNNNADNEFQSNGLSFSIVKLSVRKWSATKNDVISAVKSGKPFNIEYSWFSLDKDEQGLLSYLGIDEHFQDVTCK